MSGWLPGVILIAVGVTLFAVQLLHLDGDVIVLVIGLVFAIAFAGSRRYGLLIPAGILTGLGLGVVLEDSGVQGEPVVLGLGLGFLAIYAFDFLTSGARAGSLVAAHPRRDPDGHRRRREHVRPGRRSFDRAGLADRPCCRRRMAAAARADRDLTEITVARLIGERLRAAGVRYVTGHP